MRHGHLVRLQGLLGVWDAEGSGIDADAGGPLYAPGYY